MSKGQKAKAAAVKAAASAATPAGQAPMSQAKGKQKQTSLESAVRDPSSSKALSSSNGRDVLPDDDLMASIRAHDQAFTSLLSLIPAELYVARDKRQESDEEELSPGEIASHISAAKSNQKRKKGGRVDAEAEAKASAEKRAHLKQAKRAKLDPDNFKTPIQLQQVRAAERAEREAAKRQQRGDSVSDAENETRADFGALGAGDTDDDSDSSVELDSTDTPPTSAKASDLAAPTSNGKGAETPEAKQMQPPSGALDLRARLQAKIQAMQASRRAAAVVGSDSRDGSIDDDDMSTASTRDELLEERRRKRGEMRDRRRKAAKDRRRAEREGGPAQSGNASKGTQHAGLAKTGHSKAPELLVPTPGERSQANSRFNDVAKGDVSFSTLQFDEDVHGKKRVNRHALPSDPKTALAMLEARKKREDERQQKVKASSEGSNAKEGAAAALEALKERADRERWSKAEAAAQGVKIRDDADLLRKASKKRDKIKEKSTQAWKERARNLEQEQAARQKKRNDNIAAKKERTKSKHQGKSGGQKGSKGKGIGGKKMGGGSKAKTGIKARPGFEGRRSLPAGAGAKKGGSAGKRK